MPHRHCNDVDGYPAGIARPSLWQTPMFTDQAGNEAFNNVDMELPIVKVSSDRETHITRTHSTPVSAFTHKCLGLSRPS